MTPNLLKIAVSIWHCRYLSCCCSSSKRRIICFPAHISEHPSQQPSHKIQITMGSTEARVDYMGSSILMGVFSNADLQLQDEWKVNLCTVDTSMSEKRCEMSHLNLDMYFKCVCSLICLVSLRSLPPFIFLLCLFQWDLCPWRLAVGHFPGDHFTLHYTGPHQDWHEAAGVFHSTVRHKQTGSFHLGPWALPTSKNPSH